MLLAFSILLYIDDAASLLAKDAQYGVLLSLDILLAPAFIVGCERKFRFPGLLL